MIEARTLPWASTICRPVPRKTPGWGWAWLTAGRTSIAVSIAALTTVSATISDWTFMTCLLREGPRLRSSRAGVERRTAWLALPGGWHGWKTKSPGALARAGALVAIVRWPQAANALA